MAEVTHQSSTVLSRADRKKDCWSVALMKSKSRHSQKHSFVICYGGESKAHENKIKIEPRVTGKVRVILTKTRPRRKYDQNNSRLNPLHLFHTNQLTTLTLSIQTDPGRLLPSSVGNRTGLSCPHSSWTASYVFTNDRVVNCYYLLGRCYFLLWSVARRAPLSRRRAT